MPVLNLEQRCNLICIPVLKICGVSSLFYMALYYILTMYTEPILDETALTLGLSGSFSIITVGYVLWWFCKKYKMPEAPNYFVIFIFIAGFFNFSLMCLGNLEEAAFSFPARVTNINQIDPIKNSQRFYKIENFSTDTTTTVITYYMENNSTRTGHRFKTLYVNMLAPIINNTQLHNDYWYYKDYKQEYHETNIDETIYEEYIETCYNDFKTTANINSIAYFEKVPKKWITYDMTQALTKAAPLKTENDFTVIIPHNDDAITTSMEQLSWVCLSIIILIFFTLLSTTKAEFKNT